MFAVRPAMVLHGTDPQIEPFWLDNKDTGEVLQLERRDEEWARILNSKKNKIKFKNWLGGEGKELKKI